MKNLIYFSAIALSFSFQGSVLASGQQTDLTMDQEDFKQLVCAYMEAMPKEEALAELKVMTESMLSEDQQMTMENLSQSNTAVSNLCGF